MARMRSLKPDFFKDEDLATLPFEARILFEGLWCYADREGRLEDRPKYLKVEIFPYDNVDIEKLLNMLESPKIEGRDDKVFIRRYCVDGKKYIDIPEFLKHQSPHKTEKESLFPSFNGEVTVIKRLEKVDVEVAYYPKPVNLTHKSDPKPVREKLSKEKVSKKLTLMPENFEVSERVRAWAAEKGFSRIDEHFESFRLKCKSKDYKYADWDSAFMNAIRDNWAKIGNGNGNGNTPTRDPPMLIVSCPTCGKRVHRSDLIENWCVECHGKTSEISGN